MPSCHFNESEEPGRTVQQTALTATVTPQSGSIYTPGKSTQGWIETVGINSQSKRYGSVPTFFVRILLPILLLSFDIIPLVINSRSIWRAKKPWNL